MNSTIQMLYDKDILPAMFLVFSRKNCELYASKVSGSLIDPSDSAKVKHIIDFHLHRYKDSVQVSQQYFNIVSLLERGIAFHHSGMFPLLKEIVEILFSKGLIKVIFTTETLAIGLNLPVRSVVFTSYRKYDKEHENMRMLNTDEYTQICGRAGRRGKDTKGYVFYLPDRYPEDLADIKKMMCGSKTRLQSRMKFDYDFILKTIQSNNLNWMDLVEKSYYYTQVKRTMDTIQKELVAYENELTTLNMTQEQCTECAYEIDLKNKLKQASNAQKRKLQGDYETWKNKHVDRIWDPIRKNYARIQVIEEEKYNLNEDLNSYRNFELLSQIYSENVFNKLTQKEILLLLTCFMESENKDPIMLESVTISLSLRDILNTSAYYCKTIENSERRNSISYNTWKLNYDFIEILNSLFNGESIGTVCETFGIMEGNLTRFLLKLLNMVDEVKNIAMLNNDVSLLEKLENVQAYDFYKIANPDSLYLHI